MPVHVPLMSRLLSTLWQNIEQNFIWNSYVHFDAGGGAGVVCWNESSKALIWDMLLLLRTLKMHAKPDIAIVLDNILWPDAAIAAVTFFFVVLVGGWEREELRSLSSLVKITPELT